MAKTLSEYIDFFKALQKTFIGQYEFHSSPSLDKILQIPRLMVVINHSTPLSWIPAMTTLALEFEKSGGGQRSPRGIVDRWFYSNPISKPLAEYLSQSDRPLNFEDLVEQFENSENVDLVLSPEGANTFFGDVHHIQEFRSHRYIEIAIRTKTPLLIVGHRGSESWSIPLSIPTEVTQFISLFSSFFGQRLLQFGKINLPLLPHKIPLFKMNARLFYPSIKEDELSSDEQTRAQQILEQSLMVKAQLEKIVSELK